MRKPWTEKEIALIKAGKKPKGRTIGSIRTMRHKLGFSKPCMKWNTPEMLEALKIGVCPEGISRDLFNSARYNHGFTDKLHCKKWTKKEKNLLKAGKTVPGRTAKAVETMKAKLGLVQMKRWTDEEIEQIKRGEKPEGRSKISIRVKRSELGITGGIRKSKWAAEEIAQLKNGILPPLRTVSSAITLIHCGKIQVSDEVKKMLNEQRKKVYRENLFKLYKKGIKTYQSNDFYRMDPADVRRKIGM